MSDTSKTKPDLIPFFLFLFSFLLRLSLISKGPYSLDCLELAIKAEQILITHKFQLMFGPWYPLIIILGTAFVFLARLFSINDPVIAVNFMSVVFGSLSIVANFYLVQKLFDKTAAFFSSIMLSIFPIFLAESIYGKNHTPSTFFLLSGLACLLNYQQKKNQKYFILSIICFALMGSTRIHELILMGVPISFLYLFPPRSSKNFTSASQAKSSCHKFFTFWAIIIIITLLFHIPYFLGGYPGSNFHQFLRFWQLGLGETSNFHGFFTESLALSLSIIQSNLSSASLFIVALSFALLFKKDITKFLFLFLWFIVPLTFLGNLSTTTSRFLIISCLPLIIAQGYLFSSLIKSERPLNRAGAIFTFCFISLSLFNQIYPILRFRHEYALLPEYAQFVGEHTEPEAYVIAGDEGLFIEYYGHRTYLPRPRKREFYEKQEMAAFKKTIDEKLHQGVPVYMTGVGLEGYNSYFQFSNFILKKYDVILIGTHLSEDWHGGADVLQKRDEHLFKILPKSSAPRNSIKVMATTMKKQDPQPDLTPGKLLSGPGTP